MAYAPREAVPCDLCGRDDPVPLIVKNGYRLVRCAICELVYVSPRLRPEALAGLYDVDTYQAHQATRSRDTAADTQWRRMAAERLALLERFVPARGSMLDVGCSTGGFLAIAGASGWRTAGLDISEGSVAAARERGLDVHRGTLDVHPFAPGSFQAITLFDSIEHMPGPAAALRAVHGLLAEGGTLMLTTPNVEGAMPQTTWRLLGRRFGVWEHPTPPGHIFQFGRRTLAAALDRAGFSIAHEETEAIALGHTASELESALLDVLKGRRGIPGPEDASVDLPIPPLRPPALPPAGPAVRLARRAVRTVVRAGAWAWTGVVAGLAPRFGRGDSLVVLARKR